ncbi:hypothetical protein ScPMuIL_003663 [Solemya velum]
MSSNSSYAMRLRSGAPVVVGTQHERVLSPTVETTKDPCMITFEMEKERALMSCGHAITPCALFQFMTNELRLGRRQMRCPFIIDDNNLQPCNKVWDYTEIKAKACLTREETAEMIQKFQMNISKFEKMRERNIRNAKARHKLADENN